MKVVNPKHNRRKCTQFCLKNSSFAFKTGYSIWSKTSGFEGLENNQIKNGKIVTFTATIGKAIFQRNVLDIQLILVENSLPTCGHPVAVCSKMLDGAMHWGTRSKRFHAQECCNVLR